MYTLIPFTLLLGLTAALPSSIDRRNTEPCVLKIASTAHLCTESSTTAGNTNRANGLIGKLGTFIVHSYGSTISVPSGLYQASSSVALGTNAACKVKDMGLTAKKNNGATTKYPSSFLPLNSAWNESSAAVQVAGSNVIDVGSFGGQGMLFFTKSSNSAPSSSATDGQSAVGAGVASVTLSGKNSDTPISRRLGQYWWAAESGEPMYGDICAYRDDNDAAAAGYIYGLGHGSPLSPTAFGAAGPPSEFIYLTRVPKTNYENVSNYQYYDASKSTWASKCPQNPGTEQALQWNGNDGSARGISGGQVIWNPKLKKHVFVYGKMWAESGGSYGVFARTASSVTGPWSKEVVIMNVKPSKKDGVVKVGGVVSLIPRAPAHAIR
jgi:hypothetical protein